MTAHPGFGWPDLVFLLTGLRWTVGLTAIAFVGGAVELPIALAAGQIAVFQGTPLLLQLFVVYCGLGLIGLKLSAWAAVAVGFTLNASAVRGEIWCS